MKGLSHQTCIYGAVEALPTFPKHPQIPPFT